PLRIGIPSLILSTAFGTTVFASLQYSDVPWVKTALAFLSVLMIILTALQTFFRYAELSERHKTAGVQLGEVRRELEQVEMFKGSQPPAEKTVTTLREEWNAAE